MRDGRNTRGVTMNTQRARSVGQTGRPVLAVDVNPASLVALTPHVLKPDLQIRRMRFEAVAEAHLSGASAPALVLSPLVTPEFDALDLARMLAQGGYRGRYLALVDRLPNSSLIRREVAAQSPTINFDVIVMDGSSPLHSL